MDLLAEFPLKDGCGSEQANAHKLLNKLLICSDSYFLLKKAHLLSSSLTLINSVGGLIFII